ncbi:MAG: cytochrome c oxidase subunit II [Phycisphaerales bacterium]
MNNLFLNLGEGINSWLHKVWFRPANSDLAVDINGNMVFEGVDWLFMFILWVCIISFVMLMVPMFWWSFRYRRRAGVPAIRTPNHNTPLEVTWVVGPLIVVTFIFFWGFHGYMRAQLPAANAVELLVSAKKWSWDATYPNGASSIERCYFDFRPGSETIVRGNVDFPIFVVPAGVPVKVKLSSQDVLHSFYVADFRNKIDAFPNRYTSMTFTPLFSTPHPDGRSQVGTILETPDPADPTNYKKTKNFSAQFQHRDHFLFCAEYCGDNHSDMAGIIRVVSPEDYQTIIKKWGDIEPTMPPIEVGRIYFNSKGCSACHSIDGSTLAAPSWKGRYGTAVDFTNGTKVDANDDAWDNYIRESINEPAAKVGKGFEGYSPMPSFKGQISDRGMYAIIAYIRSLNGKGRPEDALPPKQDAPAAPQSNDSQTPPAN